jgi:hypothetical protein
LPGRTAARAAEALADAAPRFSGNPSNGRRSWSTTLPLYALDNAEYVWTPSGLRRRIPKRDKSISGRQWRKFRRKAGRVNAQMYLKALAARKAVHK